MSQGKLSLPRILQTREGRVGRDGEGAGQRALPHLLYTKAGAPLTNPVISAGRHLCLLILLCLVSGSCQKI